MSIWEFEGPNSNGNGKYIDKDVGMMKIMKKLQKYVQIHQEVNKNLMKDREKQGEFNIKLMQSMERIEKKLDKESGSRKLGSHKRTKSDSIHHQHSLWHSNKRAHNISIPSHVRKHKRSGVDEL
jgi:hypothetical protein